ncbi:ParA family protein [Cognatazoarcus halotolerans]|uniref:ParA family protein n=1 Tax=Cognatazoarcus halotolerans TaxID=2686016 RepID=UPI00135BC7DD|nr:ParA family protein [Cognatazoarcus halotolerans]MBX3680401.1 ParA family protein [Rhodocyclaceae bacterium]MCB1899161.1 ParA family protein [Rhodocyclaceae bacterium]MCP5310934.1 ParA family protein [Zoogloeaceae bacterium]
MRKILVANPKGGCGKSTIAVHLASWFAMNDEVVFIGDLDRQQSSRHWLDLRPPSQPKIHHWEPTDELVAPPKGCSVAIFDTPAGLHGKRLKQLLGEVDRVIVPVSPSRFDMMASRDFFEELAQVKAVRKDRVGVGIVGMRVDARTNSSRELVDFLEQFELPLLTCLRSTQRYVRALESGVTLFESSDAAAAIDRLQWQPLLEWLVTRRAS